MLKFAFLTQFKRILFTFDQIDLQKHLQILFTKSHTVFPFKLYKACF